MVPGVLVTTVRFLNLKLKTLVVVVGSVMVMVFEVFEARTRRAVNRKWRLSRGVHGRKIRFIGSLSLMYMQGQA